MIVATCGTVDLGAIDPLPEIAMICKKYGTWLHCDAALGGFLLLDDSIKGKAKG